jgi:DNA-directed RNA polymerase subunit RPC12/RpoP
MPCPTCRRKLLIEWRRTGHKRWQVHYRCTRCKRIVRRDKGY